MPAYIKPTWKEKAEKERNSLPGWYTLKEAAYFLGYETQAYLSRKAIEGKIITYKIGAYRLISEDLVRFLYEENKGKTRD